MLALGFVFDALGGHAAEVALGRTRQSFRDWARDWDLVSLRAAPSLYLTPLFLAWLRFQSGWILAAIGRDNPETREFERNYEWNSPQSRGPPRRWRGCKLILATDEHR